MKEFYAHAGKVGAAKHFPLTVFQKVPTSVVEHNVSPQDPSKDAILKSLKSDSPSGYLNGWGVPMGGFDVYKGVEKGDAVPDRAPRTITVDRSCLIVSIRKCRVSQVLGDTWF